VERESADTQQRELKRRTETHRLTRRVPGFPVTLSESCHRHETKNTLTNSALARASAPWDPHTMMPRRQNGAHPNL